MRNPFFPTITVHRSLKKEKEETVFKNDAVMRMKMSDDYLKLQVSSTQQKVPADRSALFQV